MANGAPFPHPRGEHFGPPSAVGGAAVATDPRGRKLICSRCGEPQPAQAELRTTDGTPLSVADYLALAGLVAGALVCSQCVSG